MEHWRNDDWQGKTEFLGDKPAPIPPYPPENPNGLSWDWTRASVTWHLTSWAMAQPFLWQNNEHQSIDLKISQSLLVQRQNHFLFFLLNSLVSFRSLMYCFSRLSVWLCWSQNINSVFKDVDGRQNKLLFPTQDNSTQTQKLLTFMSEKILPQICLFNNAFHVDFRKPCAV
jgi:hypothetical protein